MKKDILICALIALTMFQAGYLFNEYLQYKTSPVPTATVADVHDMVEELNELKYGE